MATSKIRNSVPRETNPNKTNKKINPSKPGSTPDQTPEREVDAPPVARPGKKETGKPKKIGF